MHSGTRIAMPDTCELQKTATVSEAASWQRLTSVTKFSANLCRA